MPSAMMQLMADEVASHLAAFPGTTAYVPHENRSHKDSKTIRAKMQAQDSFRALDQDLADLVLSLAFHVQVRRDCSQKLCSSEMSRLPPTMRTYARVRV